MEMGLAHTFAIVTKPLCHRFANDEICSELIERIAQDKSHFHWNKQLYHFS